MKFTKKLGLFVRLILASSFTLSAVGHAEVVVRDRHIIMMYEGLDSIWGNYLFMVSNTSDSPERFEMPLLLPREAIDWQAGQALNPDEIKLEADGGLRLEKEFPPGNHLMSLGFKLPASGGSGTLTLEPKMNLEMLGIFIPQESTLKLEGGNFKAEKNFPFSGKTYTSFSREAVPAGEKIATEVSGVPEGRASFWTLGWIVAGILVIGGGIAAFVSRPKTENDGQEVLA